MKKNLIAFVLFTSLVFIIPENANGQGGKKRGAPTRVISDADKAVVIDIFRSIDPSVYYLEFKRGSEVFGSTTIVTQEQLIDIREQRPVIGTKNYLIGSYYYGMSMVYIIKTREGVRLEDIFGKTHAAKLEAIINKYTGGSSD